MLDRRASIGANAFKFLIEVRRRQRREQLAERQRLLERSARDATEHESIREAVSREERLPASHYPLVVLPSGPHGLEVLSQDRRAQYREHLEAIVAEAVGAATHDAETTRATSQGGDSMPLAEQLCTRCGGGCCSQGGEKAYLSAATIRRFMQMHPEVQPGRIAAAYLDRLGEQTIAGSCINHTATGCSLPRQMRADTCNDYFCRPMRDWQARCASGELTLGAFVIQRRQDNWNKDRFDVTNDVVGISVVTQTGTRLPSGAPAILA